MNEFSDHTVPDWLKINTFAGISGQEKQFIPGKLNVRI